MDPTSQNCPITPGTVIAGKFRVERIIGIGGMGVVVAARHLELDDRVAIKFLLPHALDNPEIVTRFAREARAAVKIKSQHVARTFDVGRLDDGSPYIVMEYLEGVDLATQVRTGGRLSIESAITLVLQTCEALAVAHALGIIHRDLKPANLFLTRASDGSECIKVLDFGISKLAGGGVGLVTNTDATMGSPLYMAPEQMVSARDVDARCDIWSLGVTLFELLTAQRPFAGENIAQLCTEVAVGATPSVRESRADVPPGLENVISRCLEKDRERRFSNVGELALALKAYASPEALGSIQRITRVLKAVGMSVDEAETAPPTERDERVITNIDPTVSSVLKKRPSQRLRTSLILAAIAAAALVITGTVMRWNSHVAGRGGIPSSSTYAGIPTSTAFVSAAQPMVVPRGVELSSLPEPSLNASAIRKGPARAVSNRSSVLGIASSAPQSTKMPKPLASSRLPDLGGDSREY
jgi:eukaryotic-like serine/threonine-protein kinase